MILANCTVGSTRNGAAVYTARPVQIDTDPATRVPTPDVDTLLDAGTILSATLIDDPDPGAGKGWLAGDIITVTAKVGFSTLRVGTSYGVYWVVEMGGMLPHVVASLIEIPALPTACTILRNVPTRDVAGGRVDNWTTLATPNCRVVPMGGRFDEQIAESRLEVVTRWDIILPAGQDITERDRVAALGQTFEIVAVKAPASIEFFRLAQAKLVVS
jgi:head-tail adaptor